MASKGKADLQISKKGKVPQGPSSTVKPGTNSSTLLSSKKSLLAGIDLGSTKSGRKEEKAQGDLDDSGLERTSDDGDGLHQGSKRSNKSISDDDDSSQSSEEGSTERPVRPQAASTPGVKPNIAAVRSALAKVKDPSRNIRETASLKRPGRRSVEEDDNGFLSSDSESARAEASVEITGTEGTEPIDEGGDTGEGEIGPIVPLAARDDESDAEEEKAELPQSLNRVGKSANQRHNSRNVGDILERFIIKKKEDDQIAKDSTVDDTATSVNEQPSKGLASASPLRKAKPKEKLNVTAGADIVSRGSVDANQAMSRSKELSEATAKVTKRRYDDGEHEQQQVAGSRIETLMRQIEQLSEEEAGSVEDEEEPRSSSKNKVPLDHDVLGDDPANDADEPRVFSFVTEAKAKQMKARSPSPLKRAGKQAPFASPARSLDEVFDDNASDFPVSATVRRSPVRTHQRTSMSSPKQTRASKIDEGNQGDTRTAKKPRGRPRSVLSSESESEAEEYQGFVARRRESEGVIHDGKGNKEGKVGGSKLAEAVGASVRKSKKDRVLPQKEMKSSKTNALEGSRRAIDSESDADDSADDENKGKKREKTKIKRKQKHSRDEMQDVSIATVREQARRKAREAAEMRMSAAKTVALPGDSDRESDEDENDYDEDEEYKGGNHESTSSSASDEEDDDGSSESPEESEDEDEPKKKRRGRPPLNSSMNQKRSSAATFSKGEKSAQQTSSTLPLTKGRSRSLSTSSSASDEPLAIQKKGQTSAAVSAKDEGKSRETIHPGKQEEPKNPQSNATVSSQGGRVVSKYRGVSFRSSKRVQQWRASIAVNRQMKHLGYFATELEAAVKYDEAAKAQFGSNAKLNFPDGPPMVADKGAHDNVELRKKQKTSRYLGVHLSRGKFVALIYKNGKQMYLGAYVDERDAAMAYDRAAKQLGDPDAQLNFPDDLESLENERQHERAKLKENEPKVQQKRYNGVTRTNKGKFRAAYGEVKLGEFDAAEEAARAYDLELRERGGNDDDLNFPDEEGVSSLQQRERRRKKSKYRGVNQYYNGKDWAVYVTVNGEREYVGTFEDELIAARAYDQAAYKLLGKNKAKLNFPHIQPDLELDFSEYMVASARRRLEKKKLEEGKQYIGVTEEEDGKFAARIRSSNNVGGKNRDLVFLGLYPTAKEAAKAYDKAARETFGRNAVLNFEHKMGAKDEGKKRKRRKETAAEVDSDEDEQGQKDGKSSSSKKKARKRSNENDGQ